MSNAGTVNDKALRSYLRRLDMNMPGLREDLKIGREILDGEWPEGLEVSVGRSVSDNLHFRFGRTHMWAAAMAQGVGWQVADLVEGRYINHRGKYGGLRITLCDVVEGRL